MKPNKWGILKYLSAEISSKTTKEKNKFNAEQKWSVKKWGMTDAPI